MRIVFTNKFKSIVFDVTTVAIRICYVLMVYIAIFVSFICLEFHVNLTLVLTLNPSTYFAFPNGLEVVILFYLFPFLFHLGQ
jgi:hypothetical protein